MRTNNNTKPAIIKTIYLIAITFVAYVLFFRIFPENFYILNVTGFILVLVVGFYLVILGLLKETYSNGQKPLVYPENDDIESGEHNLQSIKKNKMDFLIERDKYRKEFMGNVSHELKTPLFTVQGYLLTLADGAVEDKTVRTNYLNRALKGVDRLMEIVEDLNTISKLEEGNLVLKKEKWDIVTLLSSVMDDLELKAKKRDILLRFDKVYTPPVFVEIDKRRIQQVCVNLIENAIKYNKNGGAVEVSITHLNEDKMMVNVKDEGEGIPPENLSRVFERFYRLDTARARAQGGSGLGLAIVKHILEAHGEKIEVKSEQGKGTTFSFTLENVK